INNDLWKMVRYAKDKLGGDILVSTNGNGPYSGELVPSGIDKVKIAIDSTKQEQYQRYRQHGSIDKVIEFTRKIAQDKQKRGSQTPKLIWQYIMFDFNDSDQELLDLQNQAREIGVNALRIVYTRCNNYSQKLVKDFPVAFDDIDFFQIKQESLLTVQTAKARLAEAQGLVGSVELAKAASSCIALINDTYKRLLLGVETYRDLLDAVYNPQELLRSGARSLPAEEARALYDTVVAAFFTLVEIYGRMDKADHAGKYLKFMGKVGMVTV
ncbi:MAG: hypothetical protein KKC99_05815, partial [Proteobacteria bacterium]|nr:hypothetical protein [Pseudomonadota bacterium]